MVAGDFPVALGGAAFLWENFKIGQVAFAQKFPRQKKFAGRVFAIFSLGVFCNAGVHFPVCGECVAQLAGN